VRRKGNPGVGGRQTRDQRRAALRLSALRCPSSRTRRPPGQSDPDPAPRRRVRNRPAGAATGRCGRRRRARRCPRRG